MSGWLRKFLADMPEVNTDIPDRLPLAPSVSALSVPSSGILPEQLAPSQECKTLRPTGVTHGEKWLTKFLDNTPEDGTDIPDTLPGLSRMSVLSVPFPSILPDKSPSSVVSLLPLPPLQRGWLVAYRDQSGKLCGGAEDRLHGTVSECLWNGSAWTVRLTDGQHLQLLAIRAVGKTDSCGQVTAAWTVREHGINGEG